MIKDSIEIISLYMLLFLIFKFDKYKIYVIFKCQFNYIITIMTRRVGVLKIRNHPQSLAAKQVIFICKI